MRELGLDKEIDKIETENIIGKILLKKLNSYKCAFNSYNVNFNKNSKIEGEEKVNEFLALLEKYINDSRKYIIERVDNCIEELDKVLDFDFSKEFLDEYERELKELTEDIKNKSEVLERLDRVSKKLKEITNAR